VSSNIPGTVPPAPWDFPEWYRARMREFALRWKTYQKEAPLLAEYALQCAQFARDRSQEKRAELQREKQLIAAAQRPRWGGEPQTRPRV